MELVRLALVGAGGEAISLANKPEEMTEYGRLRGGSGFVKAPQQNQWFESAQSGSYYRGSRVTRRQVVIPMIAMGGDPRTLEDRLRKLVSATSGLFTLRATYPNGDVYNLPLVYQSGLDGNYAEWVRGKGELARAVSFVAPDPYWTSQSSITEQWESGDPVPFLETLTLSSSTLSGAKNFNNPGRVSSRPTWVLDGPATSLKASIDGQGFEWSGVVDSGSQLRVEFTEKLGWQVTLDGVEVLSGLKVASKFPSIPPGQSVVDIEVNGAEVSPVKTRLSVFYPERQEVVY